MRQVNVLVTVILAITFLLGGSAMAKDDAKENALAGARFGDTWLGKEPTLERLENRVVLVENWGYQCPPCISSLSKMAGLQSKFGRAGLIVVGAHASGSSDAIKAAVLKIAKSKGVNYTLVSSGHVPGSTGKGIPHCLLLAPNGTLAWQGTPYDPKLKARIVALLKRIKSPAQLAQISLNLAIFGEDPDPADYDKVSRAVKAVTTGRLGTAKLLCKAHVEKKDVAAEQAQGLIESIDTYCEEQLAEIEKMKTDDPANAVMQLRILQKRMTGTEMAKTLAAKKTKMLADETFKTAIKAQRQYQIILKAVNKLPEKPSNPAALKRWNRRYGSSVKAIVKRLEKFRKAYPDSPFAEKLGEKVGLLTANEISPF